MWGVVDCLGKESKDIVELRLLQGLLRIHDLLEARPQLLGLLDHELGALQLHKGLVSLGNPLLEPVDHRDGPVKCHALADLFGPSRLTRLLGAAQLIEQLVSIQRCPRCLRARCRPWRAARIDRLLGKLRQPRMWLWLWRKWRRR